MKRFTNLLVIIGIFLLVSNGLLADNPPDPGGDPTGNPVGGGSPVGGGLLTLLISGMLYAFRKTYFLINRNR